MKYINKYTGINPYAVGQVRYRARTLINHPSISGMDVEDIEQELMLSYLLHIKHYNQELAGFKTFVDRVLRHKCTDLIREAEAQKRELHINVMSLDTWLADNEGEEGMP